MNPRLLAIIVSALLISSVPSFAEPPVKWEYKFINGNTVLAEEMKKAQEMMENHRADSLKKSIQAGPRDGGTNAEFQKSLADEAKRTETVSREIEELFRVKTEKVFNELGEQGWEFCGGSDKGNTAMIFKRRKP